MGTGFFGKDMLKFDNPERMQWPARRRLTPSFRWQGRLHRAGRLAT
jgi:hypothetical protein